MKTIITEENRIVKSPSSKTRVAKAVLAGAALVLFSMAMATSSSMAQAVRVRSPMPDFVANDQYDHPVELKDLAHASGEGARRSVVLAFVAGWCNPCLGDNEALEEMRAIWSRDRIDVGFAELLVFDAAHRPSTVHDAQIWAIRVPAGSPVLHETPQLTLAELAGARGLNITTYPTYVVIGVDLRVAAIVGDLGALDEAIRVLALKR